MSAPESPAVASPAAGPNYSDLNDGQLVARMLVNIHDNEALLEALKAHHTLDGGGPLLMAFARLAGMEEAEEIDVRHVRNLLGGVS